MAIKQLNPYLFFNGDAAEAIKLYERVLGAKVESIQRYGDIPGNTPKPENKDRVIHAMLMIGPAVVMISDETAGSTVSKTTNVHVCMDFEDVEDQAAKFEALAEGGQVTMALEDTFWGARFGTLVDRYGIHWMFNCDKKS